MAIIIKKDPGESEDKLISKFRRKVQQEKILTEAKDRSRFKKPSQIKNERLSRFRKKKRKTKVKKRTRY
ncbi:30S ribosomal protein S21 [Patescibacteria group bacterium]